MNRTVKVLKNVAGGRPNFYLPDVAAIAHVAVQRGARLDSVRTSALVSCLFSTTTTSRQFYSKSATMILQQIRSFDSVIRFSAIHPFSLSPQTWSSEQLEDDAMMHRHDRHNRILVHSEKSSFVHLLEA